MGLPEDAVDAMNAASGRHEGYRAAHAKGTLCEGVFTATDAAAGLTRAAHMQGEPVRATVRFSNGGGDPGVPDYARERRGMAVKLYLSDGARTDMGVLLRWVSRADGLAGFGECQACSGARGRRGEHTGSVTRAARW